MAGDEVWTTVEQYQAELDDDSELRESIRGVVRQIDKISKRTNLVIAGMHTKPNNENLKAIGAKARAILQLDILPLMNTLKQKIPVGEYYKYNDHWRMSFQRLSYVVAAITFLEREVISSIKETAALIGVPSVEDKHDVTVFLDYEEYIGGLLDMAAELSRLSRNCVIFADNIDRVYTIHEYMNQLSLGLHQINFKNDNLRKRYDGMKYHIKIVEEVIYDRKIRGLGIPPKTKNIDDSSNESSMTPTGAVTDTATMQ